MQTAGQVVGGGLSAIKRGGGNLQRFINGGTLVVRVGNVVIFQGSMASKWRSSSNLKLLINGGKLASKGSERLFFPKAAYGFEMALILTLVTNPLRGHQPTVAAHEICWEKKNIAKGLRPNKQKHDEMLENMEDVFVGG